MFVRHPAGGIIYIKKRMGISLMRFVARQASELNFLQIGHKKSVQRPTGLWTLCNTETEPTDSRSRILYKFIISDMMGKGKGCLK